MSTKVLKVHDCGLDGLTFTLPSRCQPQFAADCDLSNIVRRFLKTGELPQMVNKQTISDATDAPTDLFEALQPAVEIRQRFDQLPLEVRNQYNNDPESWAADQLKPAQPADPKPEQPEDSMPAQPEDPKPEENPA